MTGNSFSQQVSDFRTTAGGISTRLADLDGSGVSAADAAVDEFVDRGVLHGRDYSSVAALFEMSSKSA